VRFEFAGESVAQSRRTLSTCANARMRKKFHAKETSDRDTCWLIARPAGHPRFLFTHEQRGSNVVRAQKSPRIGRSAAICHSGNPKRKLKRGCKSDGGTRGLLVNQRVYKRLPSGGATRQPAAIDYTDNVIIHGECGCISFLPFFLRVPPRTLRAVSDYLRAFSRIMRKRRRGSCPRAYRDGITTVSFQSERGLIYLKISLRDDDSIVAIMHEKLS